MIRNHLQLNDQTGENLLGFLKAELNLGFTFAGFCKTELDMGNSEHAQRFKQQIAKIIETIHHFLVRLPSEEARLSIGVRCNRLERIFSVL